MGAKYILKSVQHDRIRGNVSIVLAPEAWWLPFKGTGYLLDPEAWLVTRKRWRFHKNCCNNSALKGQTGSQQHPLPHADELIFPNDYMIQQLDPEDIPGVFQERGEGDVRLAGAGVAAWVVVEGDDELGIVHEGGLVDFPGLDISAVQSAGA